MFFRRSTDRLGRHHDGPARRAPLAAIPLLTASAVAVVIALTGGSVFLSLATAGSAGPTLTASSPPTSRVAELTPTMTTVGLVVGAYVLACFLGTFFSAALVIAADDRDGMATVSHGLRQATLRTSPLIAWSLVAGTIGVIARQFGHRGLLGLVVGRPTDRDWNHTTALVLPLIVKDGLGPWTAWQRSRTLGRQRASIDAPSSGLAGSAIPALLATTLLVTAIAWPFSPAVAIAVAAAGALAVYVTTATATGVLRAEAFGTMTNQAHRVPDITEPAIVEPKAQALINPMPSASACINDADIDSDSDERELVAVA